MKISMMLKYLLMGMVFATGFAYAVPDIPSPTGVAVTAVSETEITVQWDVDASIVSYDIYRDSESIGSVIDVVDGAVISVTDADLVPGQSYSYFITACDADRVCSEPSDSMQARTFGGVEPGGSCDAGGTVPTGVYIAVDADGAATLNWNEIAGVDGYLLHVNGEYFETDAHPNLPPLALLGYSELDTYQVSAYANGEYYEKSANATLGAPTDPVDDPDLATALADLALCNSEKETLTAANELLSVDNSALLTELATAQANLATSEDALAVCLADGSNAALQADLDAANAEIVALNDAAAVNGQALSDAAAQAATDAQVIADLEAAAILDAETINALDLAAEADAVVIADLEAQVAADAVTIADLQAQIIALTP